MAAENLENMGRKLGIPVKAETNGSAGADNVLTAEEIKNAECIIIAADKNVEMARFDGKPLIQVPVAEGIHHGEELVKKMQKSGAKAYLVNTGWNGTGKRISIKDTRGIIDAILDGSIDKAQTKNLPVFDFRIPTALPGVDPAILDPRDTYKNPKEWDEKAKDLAARFIKNFDKFTGNDEGKNLVAAGPKL